MKASSLSGECANFNSAVFGVAAGVDMFCHPDVREEACSAERFRGHVLKSCRAICESLEERSAFGVRVFLREYRLKATKDNTQRLRAYRCGRRPTSLNGGHICCTLLAPAKFSNGSSITRVRVAKRG